MSEVDEPLARPRYRVQELRAERDDIGASWATLNDEAAKLRVELVEARQQISFLCDRLLAEPRDAEDLRFQVSTLEGTVEALQAARKSKPDPLRILLEHVRALEHPAALYLAPKLELRINAGGAVISPDRLWIFDGPDLDTVIAAACEHLEVPSV